MAKDKLKVLTNKAPTKQLVNLQESDVTIENLQKVFDHFLGGANIEDDNLYLEVSNVDAPILVSINPVSKYISFSCIFDASKTIPFQTKVSIINEVNNSIPFIKFVIPAEDQVNDCVYAACDLSFINGLTVVELERVVSSFIAGLTVALTDSELYKLNG